MIHPVSPYWAGLAVACLALAFWLLLRLEAARERRQRGECLWCRYLAMTDCTCAGPCTALHCPRKEGTR